MLAAQRQGWEAFVDAIRGITSNDMPDSGPHVARSRGLPGYPTATRDSRERPITWKTVIDNSWLKV